MNPIKFLKEKWYPPAERKEPFTGQVVLVTGANTGLGLEASKKVAALKADRLIITTRTKEKGEATKNTITEWLEATNASRQTTIDYVLLDMTNSNDVRAFARRLSATTTKLDSVILNAGISVSQYQTTAEGFEQTLAINAINTIYLAHLLIPYLIETSKVDHTQKHLTIVSSRNATMPAVIPSQEVFKSPQPLLEMSKPEHFPPGVMGGFIQYGRSKLILEYAFRHLSQLPELYDADRKPYVIVNTVCPGATVSDLGRNYDSWVARLLSKIVFTFFAKTTEQGANAYLTALSQGNDSMGQMWANDRLEPEWAALHSAEGKGLSDAVWNQLSEMMNRWDEIGSQVDAKV